jgi:hypothetical protein
MNSMGMFSVMNSNTAMNSLQVSSTSFQVTVDTSFQVTVNGGTLSFNGLDISVNGFPVGGGFDYLTDGYNPSDPAVNWLTYNTGTMSSSKELEVSRNGFSATNRYGDFVFYQYDQTMFYSTPIAMFGPGATTIYNSIGYFGVVNSSTLANTLQVSDSSFQVTIMGSTFGFNGMDLLINGMPIGGFDYLSETFDGTVYKLSFNTGVYAPSFRELDVSKYGFTVTNDMGQFILNKWNSMTSYGELVAIINAMGANFYTGTFSVTDLMYQQQLYVSDTTTEISNSNRRLQVRSNTSSPSPNSLSVDGTFVFMSNMMGGLSINSEMSGFNTLNVDDYQTTVRNGTGRFNVGNSSGSNTFEVNSTGATSTAWFTYSDITLKDNIIPIPSSLNKVMSLEGVQFDWKRNSKSDYGFIAQQVKEILPEVVKENDGLLTVNYTSIIAVQNEAIKELKKELDQLKKRIE